jgi:hypothetical protein
VLRYSPVFSGSDLELVLVVPPLGPTPALVAHMLEAGGLVTDSVGDFERRARTLARAPTRELSAIETPWFRC